MSNENLVRVVLRKLIVIYHTLKYLKENVIVLRGGTMIEFEKWIENNEDRIEYDQGILGGFIEINKIKEYIEDKTLMKRSDVELLIDYFDYNGAELNAQYSRHNGQKAIEVYEKLRGAFEK